jgi:hypothetical protein
VVARTIQRPVVCAGTTFCASPPLVTMPWTRSVRREVLAQQPDRGLRDDERVGGVDAELGYAPACASRPS